MRTLVLLVAALAAAAVQAQTPLDDATRSDPAIEEIVHRAAAAALVGDVGTLDDTAAEMARADAARKDRSLAPTGLTDDLRLLSAAHRPTRDARLSALDDLLDDDPDPIVERVAKNAIENQDDASAADHLLSNDRHNRRATILNDAVRPLGVFSGAVFLAAINPILLAGSAFDSLATTAINLYHYNDLSPGEREALVRYRRQLARDAETTATPEIVEAVREINVRRNEKRCTETIDAVKTALDDDNVDDARFYLLSADGLDGCRERADKVRDKVAAALAKRDARAEAARWPADDLKQPSGAERDAYDDLLVATVVGDAAGMTAAAQSYTQRYPDDDRESAVTLSLGVARDMAGQREGAEQTLKKIAGDDDGPGEIATAMLETPRFRRLDGMTSAERRHARDVAQYVLVGGKMDGRTALYTGTQLAAQGAQAAQSLGIFNVIGMVTRAWNAWRRDPASNQKIIDEGEQFLATEPDAKEASEAHARLSEAYERAGVYDRALMHYRAVNDPELKRITALEAKVAEKLLENAKKDGGEPALLNAIVRHYPMTESADEARKALDAMPKAGEIKLSREVLLAHPSLLGPGALDVGPALLDGKDANDELADAGITLSPQSMTLTVHDKSGKERTETRPISLDRYTQARAAAEDALYASALSTDPNAGEVGRFEKYVPFFITGSVGEDGVGVAPGVKLRKDPSPEDRPLYE